MLEERKERKSTTQRPFEKCDLVHWGREREVAKTTLPSVRLVPCFYVIIARALCLIGHDTLSRQLWTLNIVTNQPVYSGRIFITQFLLKVPKCTL